MNVEKIKKEKKLIIGLSESVADDFIEAMSNRESCSMKDILADPHWKQFYYFEKLILDNADDIIWNLGLLIPNNDYLTGSELKTALSNIGKELTDICFNDVMAYVSDFLDNKKWD